MDGDPGVGGAGEVKEIFEPAIIGKPYRVVCGYGYRCFDGEKWNDCDEFGNVKKKRGDRYATD